MGGRPLRELQATSKERASGKGFSDLLLLLQDVLAKVETRFQVCSSRIEMRMQGHPGVRYIEKSSVRCCGFLQHQIFTLPMPTASDIRPSHGPLYDGVGDRRQLKEVSAVVRGAVAHGQNTKVV